MKTIARNLVGAALLGLACTPALAATTPNSIITLQTPSNGKVNLVNGTLTGTVYTAGANNSKCFGLWASSTDTSAQTVSITVIKSATTYYVGPAVSVPIGSGTVAGAPPVNLLSSSVWPGPPVDGNSNPYFFLQSGDALTATAGAVTSAKTITVTAICADF